MAFRFVFLLLVCFPKAHYTEIVTFYVAYVLQYVLFNSFLLILAWFGKRGGLTLDEIGSHWVARGLFIVVSLSSSVKELFEVSAAYLALNYELNDLADDVLIWWSIKPCKCWWLVTTSSLFGFHQWMLHVSILVSAALLEHRGFKPLDYK